MSPETCLASGKDIWVQNAKTNTDHTSGLHRLPGCYRLTFHPNIRYPLIFNLLTIMYPSYLLGITVYTISPLYLVFISHLPQYLVFCAIYTPKLLYDTRSIKTFAISMLFSRFSYIGGGLLYCIEDKPGPLDKKKKIIDKKRIGLDWLRLGLGTIKKRIESPERNRAPLGNLGKYGQKNKWPLWYNSTASRLAFWLYH